MGGFTNFPLYDGNPYTYIGAYDATKYNNNALFPLGSVAQVPINPANLLTAKGYGSILTIKYVRYNSTANPAVVGGPAPVYWTDETFTTVTGTTTEASGTVGWTAGLLLPNTVSISGFTNTQLNGNYVWIALAGFVPACVSPAAVAAGDLLVGAAGSFTLTRIAVSASANGVSANLVGHAMSAVASNLCDIRLEMPIL